MNDDHIIMCNNNRNDNSDHVIKSDNIDVKNHSKKSKKKYDNIHIRLKRNNKDNNRDDDDNGGDDDDDDDEES